MKVLITGQNGQDGFLMERYLEKLGHEVLYFAGDIRDEALIKSSLSKRPDVVINFAAKSIPSECHDVKEVLEVNAWAVMKWLEHIHKTSPYCRFFNAGSIYESLPDSLYGASKRIARQIVNEYRRNHNLYAVHAQLYSHISKYSKPTVGVMKYYEQAKQIVEKIKSRNFYFDPIEVDLDYERDLSSAEDMVAAIWKVMENPNPLVNLELGSNRLTSNASFLLEVFKKLGIETRSNRGYISFTDPETGGRYPLAINKRERQIFLGVAPLNIFNQGMGNFVRLEKIVERL